MNHADSESAYKKWSAKVVRLAKLFTAVLILIMAALFIGIQVLESTSLVLWISIGTCVLWCAIGYFVLRYMVQIEKKMRTQARGSDRPEITNPLYKQIFDDYEYDQLEGFTQNIFFHTWRLRDSDNYNNRIDLIFTKRQHEIAIELSNEEVSIIIDEETDSPIEIVLKMADFHTENALFSAITAECRNATQRRGL